MQTVPEKADATIRELKKVLDSWSASNEIEDRLKGNNVSEFETYHERLDRLEEKINEVQASLKEVMQHLKSLGEPQVVQVPYQIHPWNPPPNLGEIICDETPKVYCQTELDKRSLSSDELPDPQLKHA